eukprot:CCRYP_001245-RA/>CCRYP_001245-RA protein AED:0.29 eAED:0.29 QI:26/1/1/1/0.66/0.5/4/1494/643
MDMTTQNGIGGGFPAGTNPILHQSTLIESPPPVTHLATDNPNEHNQVLPPSITSSIDASGSTASIDSSAPVPDILLSLAKDDRYISHTVTLLAQAIVPLASIFFPPRRTNRNDRGDTRDSQTNNHTSFDGEDVIEDDGQRFVERIRPELHLFAAIIVHSASFFFYTRHFGGIVTNGSDGGGARRSIGMESLNLAYSFPHGKDMGTSINSSATNARESLMGGGATHIRDSLIRIVKSIFVPWQMIDRWHALLFLQTVMPYLIERAGRGGWSKDLGGISSAFLQCCGWNSGRRLGTDSHDNDPSIDDGNEFRNDDRLRGLARRRLFEAQRRRMMSSAAHSFEGEESVENHGQEEERQGNDERSTSIELSHSSRLRRTVKRTAELSWDFLRRVFLASSALSRGAHTLARNREVTIDTGDFDRYTSLLKWLLRLHLALFYWNGIYPTFYHRLVGARIRDKVPPSYPNAILDPNGGVVVANRPTYKPVAVLILLQALTAVAQSAMEGSIELVHNIQIAFFRWRRQRRRESQQTIPERTNVYDGSEREMYLDLVEERVPSIASAEDESQRTLEQNRSGKRSKSNRSTPSNIHQCGICLNERVHPAASSVCGHVFCWDCILHWVSNIRAECPLCRAQTRPQDILPLYNYP